MSVELLRARIRVLIAEMPDCDDPAWLEREADKVFIGFEALNDKDRETLGLELLALIGVVTARIEQLGAR